MHKTPWPMVGSAAPSRMIKPWKRRFYILHRCWLVRKMLFWLEGRMIGDFWRILVNVWCFNRCKGWLDCSFVDVSETPRWRERRGGGSCVPLMNILARPCKRRSNKRTWLIDHCSYIHNMNSCVIKAWKTHASRLERGSNLCFNFTIAVDV